MELLKLLILGLLNLLNKILKILILVLLSICHLKDLYKIYMVQKLMYGLLVYLSINFYMEKHHFHIVSINLIYVVKYVHQLHIQV